MTEKPDFILAFERPKNTEIKYIRGNWYLYERFSKYDPAIKRSRKVSGRCLGTITPSGFVKTQRRLKATADSNDVSDMVEVGAVLFLWRRTAELRDRLQKHFPLSWKRLYVAAMLRLLKDPRFKRLQLHYETSILAYLFPGLSFGAADNAELLRTLGKRRADISEFMKEDVNRKNVFILFDGHRLVTSSKNMPFAELGYDSKYRFMPQTNLLYIYSLGEGTGAPVYYKQFVGSTPDVAAFSDVLIESGIDNADCTIIADKGFASENDFALLDERNLKYVIPIRRGSRFVKHLFPLTPGHFTDVFSFNERAIQALKIEEEGFNVFVYYDAQLYANELADATCRGEKANEIVARKAEAEKVRRMKGRSFLSDEELGQLKPKNLAELRDEIPEMGTVTIRTNRTELNSIQVYRIYKQRQAIEQFFKTYSTSMDFDASYMRDQTRQEAWLFLNHLSSMIGIDCIADIAAVGEDKNISLEDLRQTLNKITAIKINGQWKIAPVKRTVGKLIEKLGFSMTAADLEAVMIECINTESRT